LLVISEKPEKHRASLMEKLSAQPGQAGTHGSTGWWIGIKSTSADHDSCMGNYRTQLYTVMGKVKEFWRDDR
jgi:hypothetical protein